MNNRLQALVDRGYSKEEVLRLALFANEELEYAANKAFEYLSRDCTRVSAPTIIYIGGQPGSGKSVLSMELKNTMNNFVELGIDNYRMYHPRYLEIEKCIRRHWANKTENVNDSPGNDIADFTHLFAGMVADRVSEMASKLDEEGRAYNILMEWSMRESEGPLNSMKNLKAKGYNNVVLFLGVNESLSYRACNMRADIMKNSKHIFRKVPKYFHDLCVKTLPSSVDEIYSIGYKSGIIDHIAIISRTGEVLWDENSKDLPGTVYSRYLSESITKGNNDLFKSIAINHKELQGLIDDKEKLEKIKETVVVMVPDFVDNMKTSSR